MTSKLRAPDGAFVWIWLPGETEPVVAGRLTKEGNRLTFNYGASYLGRKNAIPIYEPELPLRQGLIDPPAGMDMPSSIRDGSPDAWGRRVIINRLVGAKAIEDAGNQLNELTFLLESGSDRIGALDFQESATEYVPRLATEASNRNGGYEDITVSGEMILKTSSGQSATRRFDARWVTTGAGASRSMLIFRWPRTLPTWAVSHMKISPFSAAYSATASTAGVGVIGRCPLAMGRARNIRCPRPAGNRA